MYTKAKYTTRQDILAHVVICQTERHYGLYRLAAATMYRDSHQVIQILTHKVTLLLDL